VLNKGMAVLSGRPSQTYSTMGDSDGYPLDAAADMDFQPLAAPMATKASVA